MHKHGNGIGEVTPVALDAVARQHIVDDHYLETSEVDVHNKLHDLEQALVAAQSAGVAVDGVTYNADDVNELIKLKNTYADRNAAAVRELEGFKALVRDTVIEFQPKYDLCDEGVSRFLSALDLEPLTREYGVTFTRTQTVTIHVDARDEDSAREAAKENLTYGYHTWDDDAEDVQITDVYES